LYCGTKQGLGLHHVANLWIALPPLTEQIRVAGYLDHTARRIETAIFNIGEQIAKFHEYRTALIIAAVNGKIDVRARRAASRRIGRV
jgi:type I restriction enzyme S subunit